MNEILRDDPVIYGPKDAEPMSKDLEEMVQKWKDTNKPSKIAASFTKIEDLQEIHLKHFKNAPYLWKPMRGEIWAGMLMDDSLDYIHLVLATTPVVEFLLGFKRKVTLKHNDANNLKCSGETPTSLA